MCPRQFQVLSGEGGVVVGEDVRTMLTQYVLFRRSGSCFIIVVFATQCVLDVDVLCSSAVVTVFTTRALREV